MSDSYIKHTADDFAEGLAALLPTGAAWPRDPDSALMLFIAGIAGIWGDVAQRSDDLLVRESDPRYTYEMLPDWENSFGLPDPCVPVVLSLPERRAALLNKMTIEGGQSRAFFIALATRLGYTITISEYAAFMFGISSFGGIRGAFYGPLARFYWTVIVPGPRLQRFIFGGSSFGRDSFLEIRRAEDLECMLKRWKPAHTVLIFDYTGV